MSMVEGGETPNLAEKLSLLPKAVKKPEQIPLPCSVGQYQPNVILRNDGYNALSVYTLEAFYTRFANILGNMERMRVDGAVLQELQGDQGTTIDIKLLYDRRQQLTTGFTQTEEGMLDIVKRPASPLGRLHEYPEEWSYGGTLPDGTKVVFTPTYDIPLNFTPDSSDKPGRNLVSPSIVVGYGSKGVVDYAFDHFSHPPVPKGRKTTSDTVVEEALLQTASAVSRKIAQVKGLK